MGLSDKELGSLAMGALGGNSGVAATAVAVALAENRSADPNATNFNSDGSTDTGLWQINSVHQRDHPQWTIPWLKVPANNAAAMAVVSKNGQDWTPWTVFKNKTYLNYKDRAAAAVGGVPWAPSGDLPDIPGVTDTAEALTGIARFFENILDPIVSAAAWLGNPGNWLRIMQVVGGIGLGYAAVNVAFKPEIEKVTSQAVKIIGPTKGLK